MAMPDNGVAVCRPARGRRAKKPCLTAQSAAVGLAVACTGTVVDLGLVEAVLAAAVSGSACPPRRAPGLQQHPLYTGLRAGLPPLAQASASAVTRSACLNGIGPTREREVQVGSQCSDCTKFIILVEGI